MDYEKEYQEAKEKDQVKYLTPEWIKIKEGETIVGLYMSREKRKSTKKRGKDYFVYTFKTNKGIVQFPVSPSFDEKDGIQMEPGDIYAIEYRKLRDLPRGHKFKEVSAILVKTAKQLEVGGEKIQE